LKIKRQIKQLNKEKDQITGGKQASFFTSEDLEEMDRQWKQNRDKERDQ